MLAPRHARVASLAALLVSLSLGAAPAAEAQTDERTALTLEGQLALPLGEPERDRFGPGGSLAAGVHRSLNPVFALGLRVRGSLLSEGDRPERSLLEDEGVGGLYTLTAAIRLRPFGDGDDYARFTGPYLELGGGGALTEDLVRPVLTTALGYVFEAGDVGIGPVARYQWVPHEGALQDDDGHFLNLGLEVVFFDGRGHYQPPPPPTPDAAPTSDECAGEEDLDGFRDADGCPDPDNDQDGILDVRDRCPNIPETFNGYNDHDGCPDTAELVLIDDRIVLNDDVFFDYDESRLRQRGMRVIRQLVRLWAQHPDWTGMTIEGHADRRGTEDYNMALSRRRSQAVRDALVSAGMDPETIELRAEGETDPAIEDADTPLEFQLNRRVEFIVDRQRPAVETTDHPSAAPEGAAEETDQ